MGCFHSQVTNRVPVFQSTPHSPPCISPPTPRYYNNNRVSVIREVMNVARFSRRDYFVRKSWQRQLEKGATIRFLLLDPKSPDVNHIARMWNCPPEDIASQIRATLREIEYLNNTNGAGLDVRLLAREPAFVTYQILSSSRRRATCL